MTSADREDLISYLWDAYKDLNGCRPRWKNFDAMSDEELVSDADWVSNQIANELRIEQEAEDLMIYRCLELGAKTEADAIRWATLVSNDWMYYDELDSIENPVDPEPLPYENTIYLENVA